MHPSAVHHPPLRHSFLLVALALALCTAAGAADDPLARLTAADQSLATGFQATVTTEPDPCDAFVDASPVIEDGVLTFDGKTAFFRSSSFYASEPVYRQPGGNPRADTDYDEQGNLVVWRTVETLRRTKAGEATELRLYQALLVTPDGVTVEQPGFHTQLRHLPATEGDLNDSDLMLLALGRGYSKLIDRALGHETKPDGGVLLQAQGRLGSGMVGRWDLDMDVDGLVRRAEFSVSDGPSVLVESQGKVAAGDVTLAKAGTVILGRSNDRTLSLSYRVQSLSPTFDTALAREISSRLDGPLPFQAEITDLRQRPITRVFVDDPDVVEPGEEDCCVCEAVNTTVYECGHLRTSVNCASDWCISNTFNTATCKQTRDEGNPNCPIVSPIPPQPQAVQVPILLANGGCATGGQPVNYQVKFTWYDGCNGCQPIGPHRHRFACEVPACPAGGLPLNRCASPRGIRRACS